MNRRPSQELQYAKNLLKIAEEELSELNKQLSSFEAQVDARLGNLLDQLSELSAETSSLDAQLRHIREERLFGTDLVQYLDGAPRPARPTNLTDLPPLGLSQRGEIHSTVNSSNTSPELNFPDIKVLYRKLARRYHPDLARSDVDRVVSNQQMTEINQAYTAGDMRALMRLAGIGIAYGVEIPKPPLQPGAQLKEPLTELEQTERKLKTVRQEINRLSSLPIVKLSLEVKLARHQRHDLLSEMAAELQYKVARKHAERDYLHAQIRANEDIKDS